MAKLLLDISSQKIRRSIEDSQNFPDSYYDKSRFPSWDIVEIPLTVAEIHEKIRVETAQKHDFNPASPSPPDSPDSSGPIDPFEQDMYWRHPTTLLWYKAVKKDFSGLYHSTTQTVGPSIMTHEENMQEEVSQEFIDSLNADGLNPL